MNANDPWRLRWRWPCVPTSAACSAGAMRSKQSARRHAGAGAGARVQPHEGTLVNQWAAQLSPAILAIDLAGGSINGIDWPRAYERYQQAVEHASEAFGADQQAVQSRCCSTCGAMPLTRSPGMSSPAPNGATREKSDTGRPHCLPTARSSSIASTATRSAAPRRCGCAPPASRALPARRHRRLEGGGQAARIEKLDVSRRGLAVEPRPDLDWRDLLARLLVRVVAGLAAWPAAPPAVFIWSRLPACRRPRAWPRLPGSWRLRRRTCPSRSRSRAWRACCPCRCHRRTRRTEPVEHGDVSMFSPATLASKGTWPLAMANTRPMWLPCSAIALWRYLIASSGFAELRGRRQGGQRGQRCQRPGRDGTS